MQLKIMQFQWSKEWGGGGESDNNFGVGSALRYNFTEFFLPLFAVAFWLENLFIIVTLSTNDGFIVV